MHDSQLETERLSLRELTLEDGPAVLAHFGDPDVTRYMDIDPCPDLAAARDIITFHMRDSGLRWGVSERQSGAFIGTCGYHCWDASGARAEIGFDLARTHWGRGLMREAVTAALTFGFESMELSAVTAFAERANTRSIRLLEHLGFEQSPDLADPEQPSCLAFLLSAPGASDRPSNPRR